VTALSAYVATSSTRLSYAGLQMAFAFYLINVTDFSISLDLTIGRDRAVGVLLGITMMWIVFERLKPTSAAEQMIRSFANSARLIAGILSGSFIGDGGKGVTWIRRQRDQLSRLFDEVHAEADAVLFETGNRRPGHMAARDRVRKWGAALRTFYLMELPLMQMRLYGDRTSISTSLLLLDKRFRECCSESLIRMANRLESEINSGSSSDRHDQSGCDALSTDLDNQGRAEMPSEEKSMLELMSQLARMINNLESEVLGTSVFATE
jgi:multidrug resistance protein MdtO